MGDDSQNRGNATSARVREPSEPQIGITLVSMEEVYKHIREWDCRIDAFNEAVKGFPQNGLECFQPIKKKYDHANSEKLWVRLHHYDDKAVKEHGDRLRKISETTLTGILPMETALDRLRHSWPDKVGEGATLKLKTGTKNLNDLGQWCLGTAEALYSKTSSVRLKVQNLGRSVRELDTGTNRLLAGYDEIVKGFNKAYIDKHAYFNNGSYVQSAFTSLRKLAQVGNVKLEALQKALTRTRSSVDNLWCEIERYISAPPTVELIHGFGSLGQRQRRIPPQNEEKSPSNEEKSPSNGGKPSPDGGNRYPPSSVSSPVVPPGSSSPMNSQIPLGQTNPQQNTSPGNWRWDSSNSPKGHPSLGAVGSLESVIQSAISGVVAGVIDGIGEGIHDLIKEFGDDSADRSNDKTSTHTTDTDSTKTDPTITDTDHSKSKESDTDESRRNSPTNDTNGKDAHEPITDSNSSGDKGKSSEEHCTDDGLDRKDSVNPTDKPSSSGKDKSNSAESDDRPSDVIPDSDITKPNSPECKVQPEDGAPKQTDPREASPEQKSGNQGDESGRGDSGKPEASHGDPW